MGLVLASAGFGMLTAPIMDLHNQKGYFLHHIIFACCTLICIICILLLPETRYQPLPETLADGDCYTRQPLLPPRKPGEQHHLLGQPESSRDYIRVHDTPPPPPHKAPATVVSTMDSTASSAVDLTAPSVINLVAMDVHGKDPNGRSYCSLPMTPLASSLDKDGVVHSSKEHLLSSTPLHRAPRVTDPLLSSAEGPGDGVKPSDITVITQLNGKVDPSHGPRAGSPVIPVLKPCRRWTLALPRRPSRGTAAPRLPLLSSPGSAPR